MDCGPIRPDDEGDVVEVHAFDGTIVSRRVLPSAPVPGVPYPTDPFMTVQLPVSQRMVPRTGLADHVRRDPAVLDMLTKEAERMRQRVGQLTEPLEYEIASRKALLARASAVLAAADRGPSLLARYWAWNQRAWAWLAARLPEVLIVVVTLAWSVVTVVGLVTGWAQDNMQDSALVMVVLVAVLGSLIALRSQEADMDAFLAEVNALAAAARPAPRWQDVELVEFTAVCACPACGAERFHYLAAADVVPDVEAETFEGPVIWRDCASWDNPENPCGFVWPQLR